MIVNAAPEMGRTRFRTARFKYSRNASHGVLLAGLWTLDFGLWTNII
jgi:hypothetical protein